MDTYPIIYIVITLLFSAFFSGYEIAFISTDKLHIELLSKKGGINNTILARLLNKQPQVIATILVGNTLALTFYGVLMARILEPWLNNYFQGTITMVLQVVLSTLLVLATAEYLPKSLFMINPDRMLKFFAIPFQIIYYILWIFSTVVVWLSKVLLVHVFTGDYSSEKPAFGLTDLNNYLSEIAKQVDDENNTSELDTEIFNNALEFKTVKIRECLIPRTELVAVDIEDSIEELQKQFVTSGYSKILVYKESIDNIIGYCHSSKLFKKPKKIKDILTSLVIVPETKLANELLIEFIAKRKNIALVVDEFGGTAGIVTMEDIVEEIFGDIQDEYDDDHLEEHQLDDNLFLFSARQEIDYINEKYELNIPAGEYDTIGGYILERFEDFPLENQIIEIDQFEFLIKSMDGLKIDKVQLKVNS